MTRDYIITTLVFCCTIIIIIIIIIDLCIHLRHYTPLPYVQPNTHCRRRPTRLSSCVESVSAVCIGHKERSSRWVKSDKVFFSSVTLLGLSICCGLDKIVTRPRQRHTRQARAGHVTRLPLPFLNPLLSVVSYGHVTEQTNQQHCYYSTLRMHDSTAD